MMKILIFAAHPDDDILGCGGMIAKNVEKGSTVRVEFFAEGTSCRYEDPNDTGIISKLNKRNESGIDALQHLGVEQYNFHNLPCGRLDQIPQIEINKKMEAAILEFSPDLLFTHSHTDTNVDHRIINSCSLIATRPISDIKVKKLLAYEVLSSTEWKFNDVFKPNYFISLDKSHLNAKISAMGFYDTEMYKYPHPRSNIGIETLARYRGMQCGSSFAEAYSLIRDFEI